MTYSEAKKTILKWLKDRDFQKHVSPDTKGNNCYKHFMGEFYTYIDFYKDRFSERILFNAGCYFDCEHGYATTRVYNLPSSPPHTYHKGLSQGIYYEEISEEILIRCLNEMFDKYLKPYYEQGTKYLKTILVKEKTLFKEDYYHISGGARDKINKMFGLNIQYDPSNKSSRFLIELLVVLLIAVLVALVNFVTK